MHAHKSSSAASTPKASGRTKKQPVFNGEYSIISSLGEGNTSKVYLIQSIKEPSKQYALKLIRDEFLKRDSDSIRSVEQEIRILKSIQHDSVINCVSYGTDGHVKKPSGRVIDNLVYIMLEFVSGGLLFDLCQTVGGMGEDGGRFFLKQMIGVLEYIHDKGIVHRDLKLENILVDEKLNLKVADFGFATYSKIDKLRSYRGTMTYMAPEIKEGRVYDGKQIDMFSTGVILFIIVNGIFPFKEAKRDEYFYKLLLKGNFEAYWKKVGGQHLSDEFKSLMQAMFSHDGKDRPTLKQLKEHPWLTKAFSVKMTRQNILDKLHCIRCERTTESSSKDGANSRGVEPMLELVREPTALDCIRFNDMTDFEIDVAPGDLWEALNEFNCDFFDSQLQLNLDFEKKCIRLKLENQAEVDPAETSQYAMGDDVEPIQIDPLEVKVKVFGVVPGEEGDDEDEPTDERYRVRFSLRHGAQADWSELLQKLRETTDLLLPTKKHQQQLSCLTSPSEDPDFERAASFQSCNLKQEQAHEASSSTASERLGSVGSV